MAKQAKRIHRGVRLVPQSTDPSNPVEGQIHVSDGSARTKGLWQYLDGTWRNNTFVQDVQKNYIQNASMDIAQRGTTITSITNGANILDRFTYSKSGVVIHTASRDSDVPTTEQAGYTFSSSLLLTLTNPDTSIGTTDVCHFGQEIEGLNFAPLHRKTVTLSFWVKATLAGIYCVSFRNSSQNRNYIIEYTINASDTWEKKTMTLELDQGGSWLFNTSIGLRVRWALMAGSSSRGAANVWQAGNLFATTNQVNGVNTGSTSFRLTGVKLNLGETATSFSLFAGALSREMDVCRRYYQKSYSIETAPGTITTEGQLEGRSNATSAAVAYGWFHFKFPVIMRASPSVTVYSPATGTAARLRDIDAAADVNVAISGNADSGVNIVNNSAFGAVSSRFSAHFVANAEL